MQQEYVACFNLAGDKFAKDDDDNNNGGDHDDNTNS